MSSIRIFCIGLFGIGLLAVESAKAQHAVEPAASTGKHVSLVCGSCKTVSNRVVNCDGCNKCDECDDGCKSRFRNPFAGLFKKKSCCDECNDCAKKDCASECDPCCEKRRLGLFDFIRSKFRKNPCNDPCVEQVCGCNPCNCDPCNCKSVKCKSCKVCEPCCDPCMKTETLVMKPVPVEKPVTEHIVAKPEVPAAPIKAKYGHADDFSWVQGQLLYAHADGGKYIVRYLPLDESDEHGGSVVISLDSRLRHFKEGEFVRVEGEIIDRQSSVMLGGPLYRMDDVAVIQAVAPFNVLK